MKIAVLASGNGSNLQALIDRQDDSNSQYRIVAVITDKPGAKAIERARNAEIPAYELSPKAFVSKQEYEKQIVQYLHQHEVQFVVLAGYMRIVGEELLQAYEGRMINLHPSLLPAFQGLHAPQQAIDAGVRVSGCTIHFVDEGLDTGPIILQQAVLVDFHDTEQSLQAKIQQHEHRMVVEVVNLYAQNRIIRHGRRTEII
ncbi:phosphoribosylglycinamide formyltransferase [Desulfuribacillus stibiiarsenatis]|uniref:Phosphoribosylglycinamide formyltransferase n=1 Tax=Desulfuribacillus stibiiarsenatis TaxID=1390249 RepID=A0A1E5L509_9FIRM|nr:phosphoribosylglycinamide formyltransferase [Desulfuribacillus stibiiarsenatis]